MSQTLVPGFLIYRGVRGVKTALPVALFHLAHLLGAGVPLSEALHEVCALESRYLMRRVWRDVHARVQAGQALSSAYSAWPQVFDPVVVAITKAGEASGQLSESSHTIQQLLEWQHGVKSRLRTVMIYPLFALTILLGVVGFLFVSVVPALENFIQEGQGVMPWHTRVLIAFSHLLAENLLAMLVVLAVAVSGFFLLRKASSATQRHIDAWLLHVPLFGRPVIELSLARYSQTSGSLYGSGVALVDALEISEGVVDNLALRHELQQSRRALLTGTTLAGAFAAARFMPAGFTRLVAAGESAGALEQALAQASEQLHSSARYSIDRFEKLVGPVLLLLVGANLLWIVVSVLSPVYSIALAAMIES